MEKPYAFWMNTCVCSEVPCLWKQQPEGKHLIFQQIELTKNEFHRIILSLRNGVRESKSKNACHVG